MNYEFLNHKDIIYISIYTLYYFSNKKCKFKEMDESKPFLKDKNYPLKKIKISLVKKRSGVYSKEETQKFQDYINKLIPYSFGMHVNFNLKSPYYSADDEEFYLTDNPIVKEKVYKYPMIRPSTWKGNFVHTAYKIIKNNYENNEDIEDFVYYFISFIRLFGSGSDEFRKLEGIIEDNKDKTKDKNNKIIDYLIKYALFEMSIKLSLSNNEKKSLTDKILMKICENINTQKGRLIIYPTYFNKLSLEVINKHNRQTKSGTNPVFYEVVPEKTEGLLQLVYIPFDSVIKSEKQLKKEIKFDLGFLQNIVSKTIEENGIGAKQKLGWGRGKIKDEGDIFIKNKINISLKNKFTFFKCDNNE